MPLLVFNGLRSNWAVLVILCFLSAINIMDLLYHHRKLVSYVADGNSTEVAWQLGMMMSNASAQSIILPGLSTHSAALKEVSSSEERADGERARALPTRRA